MVKTGAILVDIRPDAQRAIEGGIADALIVERNVLEWRFDPASDARLLVATNHDIKVIVFCSEGYTSSLAAIALQDIGLWRATDVIGGFRAWRAMGLPIVPPSEAS
jgi:rhodanese-related sulfurtransferase